MNSPDLDSSQASALPPSHSYKISKTSWIYTLSKIESHYSKPTNMVGVRLGGHHFVVLTKNCAQISPSSWQLQLQSCNFLFAISTPYKSCNHNSIWLTPNNDDEIWRWGFKKGKFEERKWWDVKCWKLWTFSGPANLKCEWTKGVDVHNNRWSVNMGEARRWKE